MKLGQISIVFGTLFGVVLAGCLPPAPTPTATNTVTDTPMAPSFPTPECKFDNLVDTSVSVPIFVPGESRVTITATDSGGLLVEFSNSTNGSGVAFQLTPALDVQGCKYMELSGTSTEDFLFQVEYKVRDGNDLKIVKTSARQSFHATVDMQTIKIPLAFGGTIDEVVIKFLMTGQSSRLVIESIRLK